MSAYDLVVIGGGAAGLAAARAAIHEGASVAMVSDGPLGGDCTFTGCVPSKTLIETAAAGATFEDAMAEVAEVVDRISGTESAAVLRREGVDVIEGRARFLDATRIAVDGRSVTGSKFVLATGSRPLVPSVPGLSDADPLTNETVWDLTRPPASLGILGGGPIGCELAQAFARLGVPTTVFEMADRVLPREEPQASVLVAQGLRASGIDLRLGQRVVRVRSGVGTVVETETGDVVEVDRILVAVGRVAVTADLALGSAGINVDPSGYVVTDRRLRTTARHIYAAGDVTGRYPFTHAADEMGRLAAWDALRRFSPFRFDARLVPRAIFTDPEVASVGVAEADAPRGSRVAELPMAENDRALAAGATTGFIKLIVGPRAVLRNLGGGQVLGATIVGQRAGELIHEPTLAMRTRMLAGRLAQTVHAYPTWSVGIQKAAGQLFMEIEGRTARPARRGRNR